MLHCTALHCTAWYIVGGARKVLWHCRFVPVVATVLAFRDLSRLLEAVLLHSETKQVTHAWLMAAAHNGSALLSSIDVFVRELSEITLICFM